MSSSSSAIVLAAQCQVRTPSASSYRRATPLPTDELADRARAEVAVHRDGRIGRHRRIRLAHRNSMRGEFSIARGASGTVMRHFVRARAFAAPTTVAALALGMTVPAASRVLIPASPAPRSDSGQLCSDPAESVHEGCSPNNCAFTKPPTVKERPSLQAPGSDRKRSLTAFVEACGTPARTALGLPQGR